MKHKFSASALLFVASFVGGGAHAQTAQQLEDTKAIGLLVQSVATNLETYQKQRDAIAVASLRNRQALENLASHNEAETTGMISTWDIAGQTDRRLMFTKLRLAADERLAELEKHNARAKEQREELAKAHSAVSANTGKLSEASATLIEMAERPSRADQGRFFLGFAKEVRAEMKKDSEKNDLEK